MESFRHILTDLWREACRHVEIAESTANIAQILACQVPLDRLIIQSVNHQRATIETLAMAGSVAEGPFQDARIQLAPDKMADLLVWLESGAVTQIHHDPFPPFVPAGVKSSVLAGPLKSTGDLLGIVLLVSHPGQPFGDRHQAVLEVLLEPFAVALENDHRFREMVALREAAEADKRSLLTRLGREDIGDTIIGAEAGWRSVMERVELVARSDAPVLILGETGTGKELVARAIHRRSPRAAGPVIRVNCGAIPPDLIDSQLFGYEKGAFTGAVESRKGWFERAHGGTLFLDEIGELPLAAQVRLLRIIQDGWLERVGGTRAINVDVRIVAATHRDLAGMVYDGKFREDLWYRIAVFPILLPPLRDRKTDIPLLARHFAHKAAVRFGLPVLMPTEEDIELLMAYRWPGNVRELGTVMDRAAIIGNGVRLEVAMALGVMAAPNAQPPAPQPQPATSKQGLLSLDDAMAVHIKAALAHTRGTIEGANGAAVLLKINPHTLRARMRKLNINWTDFRNA